MLLVARCQNTLTMTSEKRAVSLCGKSPSPANMAAHVMCLLKSQIMTLKKDKNDTVRVGRKARLAYSIGLGARTCMRIEGLVEGRANRGQVMG